MYKKLIYLIFFLILTGCSTKTQKTPIDLEHAKAIVLSQYPNCEISFITYNQSDPVPNYVLHLIDNTTHYDITVNALNGSITEYRSNPVPITASPNINHAEAKTMALNLHPGEIIDFDLDETDNIPYYKLTINDGTYEYDIEINALTGQIFETDQEIVSSKSTLYSID